MSLPIVAKSSCITLKEVEEVDGNSLTVLYSNFARQLLQVACVQGDGRNLIHITKRLTTVRWAASGTHPRRVSGKKEIPSTRRTLISRPVFASPTSGVALRSPT